MGEFYEIAGEEEKFLFGKTNLASEIRTKFIFSTVDKAMDAVSVKGESILVLSRESDFPLGKTLKESFLCASRRATLVTLSDKTVSINSLYALWQDYNTIVAAGDREILDLAKVASTEKNAKCVLIPTDCVQSDILTSIVTVTKNSKKRTVKCNPPDFAIIDKKYYFSPKKQYALEAFGETIACESDVLDYKIAVVKNKYEYKKTFVNLVGEAVYYALNVKKFKDQREPLMFAQLKLAIVKEYSSVLSFSSAAATAKILCEIAPAPFGEAKFIAYKAVLPLAKLYLSGDLQKYEVLPDGLKASKEISELLNEKEYLTARYIKDMPTAEEISENRALKATVRRPFLNDLDVALSDLSRADEIRSYLYNGKHKLSSYSPQEIKKAIKAAAYTSPCNLLALMKSEGFAEFI